MYFLIKKKIQSQKDYVFEKLNVKKNFALTEYIKTNFHKFTINKGFYKRVLVEEPTAEAKVAFILFKKNLTLSAEVVMRIPKKKYISL